MTEPAPNFCAAPWVEGLLRPNGSMETCCRNPTSFGDWRENGLKQVWQSGSFQKFRANIVAGKFPDAHCRRCYDNGTARSLYQELHGPFQVNKRIVFDYLNTALSDLTHIERLFALKELTDEATDVLVRYFHALDTLENNFPNPAPDQQGMLKKVRGKTFYVADSLVDEAKKHRRFGTALVKSGFSSLVGHLSAKPIRHADAATTYQNALVKLRTIGRITESYINGHLTPPVVAPFRQIGLIYRCNARCIHCPGWFSGEITGGPELARDRVDQAFSDPEGIIDFYMNGSEFLLYRDWKKIAARLVDNGTKLSISTNGILLTPPTIQYLIDEQIIKSLNVSMDGATKETVETIRRNVNFAKLLRNIDFLFSYASAKPYQFSLSFSFVLMKRNYREFPKLIGLIDEIRAGRECLPVSVYCQALENADIEGYGDFVRREHHSLVDRNELVRTFGQVLRESQRTGIPANAFYYVPIKDFVQQGYPFPPLAM